MQHNYKFEEFMNAEYNTMIDDYFSKDRFPEINKSSAYRFAFDELGIPIRNDCEDKKSVFGWYRIGDKFYHYTVNYQLLDKLPKSEVRELALAEIKRKHKSAFSPRSQMKRFLDIYDSK